jgi:hypothetical protein
MPVFGFNSAFLGNLPRKSTAHGTILDFDRSDLQKDAMESMPPPLPATPPPSAPRQPRGDWWSRNWKWFVPTGCLTLVAMGVAFVVCIFLLVFSVLKSTDVYKTALERAKSDDRVVGALGSPIRTGMFTSGKINATGPSGDADIGIPISGPKGKATIYAVATKSAGKWEFSKLAVQVDGGEMIDLNESTESASADESKMENEEAGDERIEAITLAREDHGKLHPVKNFKQADNPEHIVVVLTDGNERDTHQNDLDKPECWRRDEPETLDERPGHGRIKSPRRLLAFQQQRQIISAGRLQDRRLSRRRTDSDRALQSAVNRRYFSDRSLLHKTNL